MKLLDVVLLSLSVVFLVIATYEIVKFGLPHAYWSLMLAVATFFAYAYRKKAREQ